MAKDERSKMNIAMRAAGVFLIVVGMCMLLAAPRVRHSSYTESYVEILAHQFGLKPGAEDIRLDPKTEPQWHNMIAGTLETYAAKVCSESYQNRNIFGMLFQITGLAILFTATACCGTKTSPLKQKAANQSS